MEIFMTMVSLVALTVSTTTSILAFWQLSEKKRQKSEEQKPKAAQEPLPEELEARRIAAEAQRLYEQGFVNLMTYDGSPKRKEERENL